MLAGPSWYRKSEHLLLSKGKPLIVAGLVSIIGISGFFLYSVVLEDQRATAAAVWITYVFMP